MDLERQEMSAVLFHCLQKLLDRAPESSADQLQIHSVIGAKPRNLQARFRQSLYFDAFPKSLPKGVQLCLG